MAGSARRAALAAATKAETGQDELLYNISWLVQRHVNESAAAAILDTTDNPACLQLGTSGASEIVPIATAIAVAQGVVISGSKSLSFVTASVQGGRGAQIVPCGLCTVGSTGLWGVARTLAQEMPLVHTAAVDVQPAAASTLDPLIALCTTNQNMSVEASPYGMCLKQGALVAATLGAATTKPSLPPFRLLPQPRGALQNLQPEQLSDAGPGRGRAQIAVKAVGINFRVE